MIARLSLALVVTLVVLVSAAHALDPAVRCEAGSNKIAGGYLSAALPSSQPISSWRNNGPDVPLPGGENVRMNLWLVNGSDPMNGQPDEVLISNFLFAP